MRRIGKTNLKLPLTVHLEATNLYESAKENYAKQLEILRKKAKKMVLNNYKDSEYSVILFKNCIDLYSFKHGLNLVIWLKEP